MKSIPSLTVFDWNELRGLPANNALPEGVNALLPDMITLEVADMFARGEPKAEQMARKLGGIFCRNSARIWVGHYWEEVSRRERSTGVILGQRHVIEKDLTSALRALVVNPDEWPTRMRAIVGGEEQSAYERNRQQFLSFCNGWSEYCANTYSDQLDDLRESREAQVSWIRTPDLLAEWVAKANPRLAKPAWKPLLARFPDRLACCRWTRIVAWHALQRALHPNSNEHRFENNWDDAYYAFLASYTGSIATRDKRLMDLIDAVFPGVVRYVVPALP